MIWCGVGGWISRTLPRRYRKQREGAAELAVVSGRRYGKVPTKLTSSPWVFASAAHAATSTCSPAFPAHEKPTTYLRLPRAGSDRFPLAVQRACQKRVGIRRLC